MSALCSHNHYCLNYFPKYYRFNTVSREVHKLQVCENKLHNEEVSNLDKLRFLTVDKNQGDFNEMDM
jgi:hypothetical protein